ncbi:MAG: competence/damage-inducible protein A [Flavobacteriales bacterium]|nr:competence/damage-inducible protein A [Flavobacteriales bacterium]
MNAEVIAIGDELLIGQVIDTNSAWIGQQLNTIGLDVLRAMSIRDRRDDIIESLDLALSRVDIILITGGLGPTKDDITKQTLCEYFGTELVLNEVVLERISSFFSSRGINMLEGNIHQAMLPEACTVIDNLLGTASGMWFEKDGKVIISMPGVPHEMKGMMASSILPALAKRFVGDEIIHRTILTYGIGESLLAHKIQHWENSLGDKKIKLAYLPAPGMVRLRMTLHGTKRKEMQDLLNETEKEVFPIIQEYIYGYDNDSLGHIIGRLLVENNSSLGLAESCTGGYISHIITSVPGCSRYFYGSIVPYQVEIKEKTGLAKAETLFHSGAVSEQTAIEMARGIMSIMGSNFSLATTGIAGPDGGNAENPVGTIWIGIGSPRGVRAVKHNFGKNRERNIQMAAQGALFMLRKEIIGTFAQD